MTSVPEITALFAELASHLQTTTSSTTAQAPLLPSISSLNQSLNLNEDQSRVRVLNKALSLMCFKAPQVFDEEIKCSVDTIVSVLSSCVSNEVFRFEKEEFLRIGSLISSRDSVKLIETVLGISPKLNGHDTLKQLLFRAVLRVAASSSSYEGVFPFMHVLRLEPKYRKSSCISELQDICCDEISVNNHEIPLRLLLWYLDPLNLKHDISNILREFVDRPFIDLKKELHDRMSWRSIIVCLVLSPTKFFETRTLLHHWLLTTGLASVLELQIQLVSSVLDVLVQPMQWSISMELAQKLPFPDAYFPSDNYLVNTLTGPISGETFLGLVHHIRGSTFPVEKNTHPSFEENSTCTKLIDHKSTWATLMVFPEWFFFATVLLFSKKDSQSWARCISGRIGNIQTQDPEQHRAGAARYLAYIISPMSKSSSELLVKYLIQLSESWILKQTSSHKQNGKSVSNKTFRKTKLRDNKKDNRVGQVIDGQALRDWLNEFNEYYMRYWTDTANSCISKRAKTKNSLLFRKVALGILIGCSDLDEEGHELLLHYAATGEILEAMGTRGMCLTEDAVTGPCLVFDFCGVVEDMSTSIFDTDESRVSFTCQLKLKAAGFIVNCIRKLLQVKIGENCKMSTLIDLHKRLKDWSSRGGEILQNLQSLKDVLNALNSKIHFQ